jgi:hypothetical protein
VFDVCILLFDVNIIALSSDSESVFFAILLENFKYCKEFA